MAKSLAKTQLRYSLVVSVTSASSTSSTISWVPSDSSSHQVFAEILLTDKPHSCCEVQMAVRMERSVGAATGYDSIVRTQSGSMRVPAGVSKVASTVVKLLKANTSSILSGREEVEAVDSPSPKSSTAATSTRDLHPILDDLLQLVPALFSRYDRSAEVDEGKQKELAENFETAPTRPSEEDNNLINAALEYEKKPWRRIPGTVRNTTE
ncbi:hypothetical protein TeGR_g11598 [Tetraparma gracilis]|uniref:Uncharacterized protein n=1 Tax=Tetraparma gracilis TaxID=2962635 RepID=A0ABQ6M6P8_9STRA|nr:hypothetical protein TeGR_g11598 [Tetraparma gracilis]